MLFFLEDLPLILPEVYGMTKRYRLLSNNPKKRVGLMGYGIEIIESVALEIDSNIHNEFYLKTKRDKMGHSFKKLDE
jgi:3,4-dihydroxy 2-butanone 4-phosphate synthase/GTP cyclohydrolase II